MVVYQHTKGIAPLGFIENNILSQAAQGVTKLMENQVENLYVPTDTLAVNYFLTKQLKAALTDPPSFSLVTGQRASIYILCFTVL